MEAKNRVNEIQNSDGKVVMAIKYCEETGNVIVLYDEEIKECKWHFHKLQQTPEKGGR